MQGLLTLARAMSASGFRLEYTPAGRTGAFVLETRSYEPQDIVALLIVGSPPEVTMLTGGSWPSQRMPIPSRVEPMSTVRLLPESPARPDGAFVLVWRRSSRGR